MMLSRIALALLLAGGITMLPSPVEHSAEAAAKKTTKKKKTTKRSDFTPEQRERMAEQGRKICRDSYGATSRMVRIDYSTMRVWCYTG